MPAGYGWSFPADDEVRVGVGSFDPRFHVKEPTVQAGRGPATPSRSRYQGNWIPHALREATEDGIFFVGDSAGHCLPLTAEGIRTALYFGIACGASCAQSSRRRKRRAALARYGAFSAAHTMEVRVDAARSAAGPARPAARARPALRAMGEQRFIDWSFNHYLEIAHPSFVGLGAPPVARSTGAALATA